MKYSVEDVYTKLFNEDTRLCRSNSTSVEFLTNQKYILQELSKGDKILELGAATGRYTMMLADLGYHVTALEFVKENLDVLQTKIETHHNVTPVLGDASDLSRFDDESFDVVLNMGPLYHFPNEEDRDNVVKESMRVLKKGGTAFFAFINNDMVFVTESLIYNNKFLLNDSKHYNKATHKIPDNPFTVLTVEVIRNLMKKHNCTEYKFIASDGYAELLSKDIDKLSEEQFFNWMNYHLYTCEKRECLGASHHLLYVTKK